MEHEERVTFESDEWVEHIGILSRPNEQAPVVILAHGLGSSKDGSTYYGLQHALQAYGIGSLRIDLFGHGESQGQFRELTLGHAIKSVQAAREWLRKRCRHARIGLCGSSFGGAAVYYAGLDAAAVALIAPSLDPKRRRRGLRAWKERGWTEYVTYAGEKRRLDYAFHEEYQGYDPATVRFDGQVAFFHGKQDRIVPFAESETQAKRLKAPLHAYLGAGHNFDGDGEKDRLIHDVTAFFVHAFALDERHAGRH